MNVHDFTQLDDPAFVYRIKGADGKPQEIKVDLIKALLELQYQIPTAMTVVPDPENPGEEIPGLALVLRAMKAGKEAPKSLPSIQHVMAAVGKAFNMPEEASYSMRMHVVNAFSAEMSKMVEAKKDAPGSPDSSASTPA